MSDVSDNPVEQVQESDMPNEITGYTAEEFVTHWKRIFAAYPTMEETVQAMAQVLIEANKLGDE